MTSASNTILRHAGLLPRLTPIFWIVALFAFTILPGRAFGEREYFAVLFALPVVALWTARASGANPSLADMIVAGLCAGAATAIEPRYALIPLAMAPYLIWRVGALRALTALETYVGAAFAFRLIPPTRS